MSKDTEHFLEAWAATKKAYNCVVNMLCEAKKSGRQDACVSMTTNEMATLFQAHAAITYFDTLMTLIEKSEKED